MEASNRSLPTWFDQAKTGQLRLPRFQRFEAWGHNEITNLLETILDGLPTGAALVLNVGDEEQFESRPLSGIPDDAGRCTEHLLDGQQRLTALWKSLNDLYAERTYLVYYDEGDDGRILPRVYGVARWQNNGRRFPRWVDDPCSVRDRRYFPLSLLRPGETATEIRDWCDTAARGDILLSREIEDDIRPLRERIITFNLPFLALPSTTPSHVALDVFIKMNTSSVSLTAFDIIVARFEGRTGQSLHQLVQNLVAQVPEIQSYQAPKDLILSAAAMREDRTPTQASFHRLDLNDLADTWAELADGIRWSIDTLEEESILDADRLPTVAVLPVLVALHRNMPQALDDRGRAKRIVRSYVWRAFFTHRYDNSAATRALQDLRGLIESIGSRDATRQAPIFDEDEFPLPSNDELVRAGWPRRKDTLARAILALSLKRGARDFADDERATRQQLSRREYHHLFPDHLLTDDGQLSTDESYRALNCALITWNTNRRIAAKEPIHYLQERAASATLGQHEVKRRLASHLIPYSELSVGGYREIDEAAERATQIQNDYRTFLLSRAALIQNPIRALCDGEAWPVSDDG